MNSLCDSCVHVNVCGLEEEGILSKEDPALMYCGDYLGRFMFSAAYIKQMAMLLHKETGCPLDECLKALETTNPMEYLRKKGGPSA